jgi:hypothetical protein
MTVYRDHLIAAQLRQQHIGLEVDHQALPNAVLRVHARRAARVWASALGLGTLVAMVVHFLLTASFQALGIYLLASWALTGIVYATVRIGAGHMLKRHVQHRYATSGDIFYDLGRLDDQLPLSYLLNRVQRLERLSLQLPLLLVSLAAPLTLHLLVSLTFLQVSLSEFGQWILTSAVLVGHAHLTLALFAVFHASRVQRELDRGDRVVGASRGLVALAWTVGSSAIPGVVLLCIPPLLVAVTGMMFVPWSFHWAAATGARERAVLDFHGLLEEYGPGNAGCSASPVCEFDDEPTQPS